MNRFALVSALVYAGLAAIVIVALRYLLPGSWITLGALFTLILLWFWARMLRRRRRG